MSSMDAYLNRRRHPISIDWLDQGPRPPSGHFWAKMRRLIPINVNLPEWEKKQLEPETEVVLLVNQPGRSYVQRVGSTVFFNLREWELQARIDDL